MADISMDNVNIEIESSSEKASQGVATLIESLTNLNSKLSSVQNNATKYAKNIQNVGNILKSIKMPKLPKISDIFKKNKPTQENPLQDMHLNNNQKKVEIIITVKKAKKTFQKLIKQLKN